MTDEITKLVCVNTEKDQGSNLRHSLFKSQRHWQWRLRRNHMCERRTAKRVWCLGRQMKAIFEGGKSAQPYWILRSQAEYRILTLPSKYIQNMTTSHYVQMITLIQVISISVHYLLNWSLCFHHCSQQYILNTAARVFF